MSRSWDIPKLKQVKLNTERYRATDYQLMAHWILKPIFKQQRSLQKCSKEPFSLVIPQCLHIFTFPQFTCWYQLYQNSYIVWIESCTLPRLIIENKTRTKKIYLKHIDTLRQYASGRVTLWFTKSIGTRLWIHRSISGTQVYSVRRLR